LDPFGFKKLLANAGNVLPELAGTRQRAPGAASQALTGRDTAGRGWGDEKLGLKRPFRSSGAGWICCAPAGQKTPEERGAEAA